MCDQIAKLAVGGQEGECDRTRFTILTKVRRARGEGVLSVFFFSAEVIYGHVPMQNAQ